MNRLLFIVGLILTAVPLETWAQTPTAGTWTAPRTSEGRPDFEGIWTTQTFTPLQRPDRYKGREFLTDEEMAELIRLVNQEGVDPLAGALLSVSDEERTQRVKQTDPTHYNNAQWLATPTPKALSSRRTSLIVDPPDGRFPPLTPEGQKRAAERRAANGFDSYLNRPLQERCVVWTHEGPPMLPPPYNDVLRILQTPGYVVVHRELSTNLPRIIPTTERPHLPERLRQWAGNSVGRWEGDTLVVETTNYNDKVAFQGSSAGLRVVERFRRVSADKIDYRFTVEDPATWTRPWSVELPMLKTEGRPYEYGCHEGNYGVVNILRGARVADQKATAPANVPR
jgi:hypothetical protein